MKPYAGTAVFSATLNEPTLTLVEMDIIPDDDITLQLIRKSGSSGQIQGEWSLELGSNSYLVTFAEDGALIMSGNIQQCSVD